MKTYHFTLQSTAPIAFGRNYTEEIPKESKESADDYERRTWMNRAHIDGDGNLFIPPLAFKNALTSTASYLGMKIPGKRNATYTKHFMSGVLVVKPVVIGHKDDIKGQWLYVSSSGERGGGKRVWKCFPTVATWSGDLEVVVLDETITEDVLVNHLIEAGNFIGVGSLRVQNNGIYGRFSVTPKKVG